MKPFIGSAIVFWLVLTSHATGAQQSESIPSPEEFHGYELGTTYTITANLYEYYRELAPAPRSPLPIEPQMFLEEALHPDDPVSHGFFVAAEAVVFIRVFHVVDEIVLPQLTHALDPDLRLSGQHR